MGGEPVQNKTIINHYPDSLRDCQKPLTLSSWTGGRRPPTQKEPWGARKKWTSPHRSTLLSSVPGRVHVNVTGGTTLCWQLLHEEVVSGDSHAHSSALMEKKMH